MRTDQERILDILEAIKNIEKYHARGKSAFYTDELLQSWVVRNLQIIGEAANQISDQVKETSVNIPWKKIIGMRHVLVHGYFEIDLDVVWAVIENDFDDLRREFQNIAANMGIS